MLKKVKILIIILLIITVILTGFCFGYLFYHNRGSKYLNDFKYQKLDFHVSDEINSKINKVLKTHTLVNNTIVNNKYANFLTKKDGNYSNYLYNYHSGEKIKVNEIFKDEEGYLFFLDKVEEMCNLKYPKFICNTVKEYDYSYDILDNKIVVYFTKDERLSVLKEDLFVEVNYVEIIIDDNNILNFTYHLDTDYVNPNFYKLDPNKTTIAFTFDDGPGGSKTDRLLDTLMENHANATFFLIGNKVNANKNIVKKMSDNGFEIGNHSYNHANLAKLKNGKLTDNLSMSENIIKDITGKEITMIRPPYGAINDYVRASFDKKFILWSVDTNDWRYRNVDHIVNHILDNATDGDIVLMHDVYDTTIDSVQVVLEELYLRGYQVVSVSELAEFKGVTLENHHAYRAIK